MNVKALEPEIEKDLTSKILGNVESSIGKMEEMIQTQVNNSNFSKVQNIPCFMCYSINHSSGECVENEEVNAMNQAPPYNAWNGHGNGNYINSL